MTDWGGLQNPTRNSLNKYRER